MFMALKGAAGEKFLKFLFINWKFEEIFFVIIIKKYSPDYLYHLVRSNNKSFEDCVCKTIGVDDDSDLISNVYIPSFFQINQWKDKYEQQTQIKQMLEPIFTSTRKVPIIFKKSLLNTIIKIFLGPILFQGQLFVQCVCVKYSSKAWEH